MMEARRQPLAESSGELKSRTEELAREKIDRLARTAEDSSAEPEALDALLWEVLELCQGWEFRTARGLVFTYYLKGYEMFVDRKDKSLTRATVMLAFHTALELQKKGLPVSGPKKLKTFGASYLYPIFIALGLIRGPQAADHGQ